MAALALCASAEAQQVYYPREVAIRAPVTPPVAEKRVVVEERVKEMPLFSAEQKETRRPRRPDFSHVGLPCEPKPRQCTEVLQ
jgi:hypothetical protein